jgi:hypothetical protein
MISEGFKKQLIDNTYKTQLLPKTNTVGRITIDANKRIINFLLFKRDESLYVGYKNNYNNINNIYNNIRLFLNGLTNSIYEIYQYSGNNGKYNIQQTLLSALKIKQNIENNHDYVEYSSDYVEYSPEYVEYLKDIYD